MIEIADPTIKDYVKVALRISSTTTTYDTEITDLINAAKADLELSGVLNEFVDDTNALIKQAIITYVKANFGWDNPDADRLQRAYDMLKSHLTLTRDYAFFKVTFTVTDSETDEAIRGAEVTFNGEVKTTDENGQAIFYVREGNNYEYTVEADDYESDDDDDNLVDVTTNTTVEITLTLA